MWHCHWRMIVKLVPQNELNAGPENGQLSPLSCIFFFFYLRQISNVTDLRSVVWSWVGTSCFIEVWWIGWCTLPQEQTYLSTDSSLQDNVLMWQWWFLNKPHYDSVNRNLVMLTESNRRWQEELVVITVSVLLVHKEKLYFFSYIVVCYST